MAARRRSRDVDVSLLTHHVDLDFQQPLAHDDVNGLGLNEVAMYTGNDLTYPISSITRTLKLKSGSSAHLANRLNQ